MKRMSTVAPKKVYGDVPRHIHFQFKNKAHFYDLTEGEVIAKLITLFATTKDLDHIFNIPSPLE